MSIVYLGQKTGICSNLESTTLTEIDLLSGDITFEVWTEYCEFDKVMVCFHYTTIMHLFGNNGRLNEPTERENGIYISDDHDTIEFVINGEIVYRDSEYYFCEALYNLLA